MPRRALGIVLGVLLLGQVPELRAEPRADRVAGAGAGRAWSSEKDLLSHLARSAVEELDELALLRRCISRSWWAAARELVSRAHAHGAVDPMSASDGFAPVREEVTSLVAELKQTADVFAAYADTTYRGQTRGLDEVHCALQWAQNSSTVFLAAKYAARWSAPGAIEVVDLRVNLSSCCLDLDGFGHHSGLRKRYMANVSLFADISPDQSIWSAASVGRITLTLQKASPGKWPRLTQSRDKSRHQISTWLDMDERWHDELKRFTGTASDGRREASTTPAPTLKGATRSAEKGARVLTPRRKAILRIWKRMLAGLRRACDDPLVLGGVAAVALLLACWASGSARRPGKHKASAPPAL